MPRARAMARVVERTVLREEPAAQRVRHEQGQDRGVDRGDVFRLRVRGWRVGHVQVELAGLGSALADDDSTALS